MSRVLQTDDGQILEAHSISAGLDYPGIGPEHAFFAESGRATYANVTDEEALEAIKLTCETEGILPAIETAHAIAHLSKIGTDFSADDVIVLCCSGRGDKDITTLKDAMNL